MDGVQLVHSVQDSCLTDRNGNKVGRVDVLVLSLNEGEPPRVSHILIGGPVRDERIGRWMVWLHHVMCALLRLDRKDGVSRVPFSAVREIADTIKLDVEARTLPSQHFERWLGKHVIGHIPGSHGDRK